MTMKRILLFAFLVLTIASHVFAASAAIALSDNISLTLFPADPIYQESRAYPFSNDFSFSFFASPKQEEYIVNKVLVTNPGVDQVSGRYKEYEVESLDLSDNIFWQLKAATNVGFLRFSYKDIVEIEGYLHGGVNTVHGAYGAQDVLGHDGQYGAGVAIGLFDKLAIRVGFHHFSGHWGDEVLTEFYGDEFWSDSYNPPEKGPGKDFYKLTEYTRNNSTLIDVSYSPFKFFRVLAEFEIPEKSAWIRPAAHIPSDTLVPNSENPLDERIYSQEGFKKGNDYPKSFQAYRIGLGAEFEYPIDNIGYAYLAGDIQLHQDGKINLETLEYEEDRPWDIEYTITAGFAFQMQDNMPELAIKLSYHDGRFPLLNYFFQESRYFSVGIGLVI